MRSVLSMLVIGLIVGGCSSSLEPGALAGQWHQNFGFPGAFFEMTLRGTSAGIEGSGFGCGEAAQCGSYAITGTVDGNGVHLDLIETVQQPQGNAVFTWHFDGHRYLSNTLRGTLRSTGPSAEVGLSYPVTYQRGGLNFPTIQALDRSR